MTSSMTSRLELGENFAEPRHGPIESVSANDKADSVAWMQSILDQFEGPLLRYAHRITGDLELARDVVQDTLLRVLHEDRAALEGHLARWLFHVCRNRALDVQRKEQRMSVATDLDLRSLPHETGPADELVLRETSSRLLNLLEGLTALQQEVIRLKFQSDMSYREIAEVTGQSVSHVGVLLHTGLKRLRSLMKNHE